MGLSNLIGNRLSSVWGLRRHVLQSWWSRLVKAMLLLWGIGSRWRCLGEILRLRNLLHWSRCRWYGLGIILRCLSSVQGSGTSLLHWLRTIWTYV